jgi:hypothetical protein
VIWSDKEFNNGVGYDLYFARSTDNGANFDSATVLCDYSADKNCGESHHVVASGNNIYVTRTEYPEGLLMLSRSTDNGATFGNWVNISKNIGKSSNAQIAVSGSSVYVVWQSNANGNYEVLFIASNDNGATFGNITNLSNNSENSAGPQMIFTGNKMHVMWVDGMRTDENTTNLTLSLKTSS